MRVLVACEFSGTVREAFRLRGHDAVSCDLLPDELQSPYHYIGDVRDIINDNFDLLIAHPPCTHLSSSGARHFAEKRADGRQSEAIDFFLFFTKTNISKVCIENPIGIMSTIYKRPTQYIQPWQFGHGETKRTCLWLKNLPTLKPTNIVDGRENRIWKMSPHKDRGKLRSVTYQGIADAMAEQWGV